MEIDQHSRGDINAPLVLVEYSDFECPFCKRFADTLEQVLSEYQGQIRHVYKHFPLSFHDHAESASLASECAAEQGLFWDYHDKIYENQNDLGRDTYLSIARDIELNMYEFISCLDSQKYQDKVDQHFDEGVKDGISGTPGSYIIDSNNERTAIKGAQSYSSVASIINGLLAE
ncbi:DsbA family protein [Patescibacteria group bacterium]